MFQPWAPEASNEAWAEAQVYDPEVIRPLEKPVSPSGALAILHGSLAPDGAVIKAVAADPALLRHRGPAVTFEDYADLEARIDDPDLPVTPDSVLVLKRAGPVGGPGMPEWGMLPIPQKTAGGGRPRHGADLRRAYERHQLWDMRFARGAGSSRRGSAGLRPRRR